MAILLSGGCGFIGSHQAVILLEAGHEVVVVDDLSNARASVVDRIAHIAGRRPEFFELDVRDTEALARIMVSTGCDSIIHFAGLKHVAESMERAVDYLDVNVGGLTSVLRAADTAGARRLIFSSSGSIYGPATEIPIPEHAPIQPTNPYSRSKAICEEILSTVCAVDPGWSVMSLRYFNPAGAHPSGLIGEDPTHLISNIVPVVMETATGDRDAVPVYGTDFDTPDGTAIRDYIHVMDVVEAHAGALDLLSDNPGFEALNIGRGEGVSVRQLIAAAEKALDRSIPFTEGPRRPGDVAALVAATELSRKRLGHTEFRTVDEIFGDAWRFRMGRTT